MSDESNKEPQAKRPQEDASDATKPLVTWRDLHLWQIQPIRDILLVVAAFWVIDIGYSISIVTVPLLLAVLLAYLFEPLVRRMLRARIFGRQMSRQVAAATIIFGAGITIVIPLSVAAVFAVTQGLTYASELVEDIDEVITSSNAEREFQQRLDLYELDVAAREDFDERDQSESAEDSNEDEEEAEPAPPTREQLETRRTQLDERERAVQKLYAELPSGTWRQVHTWLVDVQEQADSDQSNVVNIALNWLRNNAEAVVKQAASVGEGAVNTALATLGTVGRFLFMGFLTAFFFYFISSGWGQVTEFVTGLFPERSKPRALDLMEKMDAVVSAFIRGRLTISLILMVFFTFAYWVVGAPAPLILGPVVGILSIAPYISLLGLPITIGAMLLQPPGNPLFDFQTETWWAFIGPFAVYQAGQVLDDYILTPAIQGKSVDMDTPSILFATIAGGALAGIYGVLIAIPVAACVKILLQEIFWPAFRAWAKGERTDFLPIARE